MTDTGEERYTKAPSHPANLPDGDKSMGIGHGMLREDNPLLGVRGASVLSSMMSKFSKKQEPMASFDPDSDEDADVDTDAGTLDTADEADDDDAVSVGDPKIVFMRLLWKFVKEVLCGARGMNADK